MKNTRKNIIYSLTAFYYPEGTEKMLESISEAIEESWNTWNPEIIGTYDTMKDFVIQWVEEADFESLGYDESELKKLFDY